MNQYKKYGGLLQYKECLIPTWKGAFLLSIFFVCFAALSITNVHPFLSTNQPIQAEILVVEGWVPDYVLKEAKTEFEQGKYQMIYVTGGPLEKGNIFSEYHTYAELGASILLRMGIGSHAIEAAPSTYARQDRTYTSAVALKDLLRKKGIRGTRINLISLGAHSRRSHLLFQKALGENYRIGIIAIEDRSYDPRHWWKFSAGVRSITDELFAYAYARIIFPLFNP